MTGAVFGKELTEYFRDRRFLTILALLFVLVAVSAVIAAVGLVNLLTIGVVFSEFAGVNYNAMLHQVSTKASLG